MKALHYGGGNIGRGFIGLLLFQSGYHLVFADVVPALIDSMNHQQRYRVITLGQTQSIHEVNDIRAVDLRSADCFAEVVDADLITTAVGVRNLEGVADSLAAGLCLRKEHGIEKPLNILACENALNATDLLAELIKNKLPLAMQEYVESHVGFANVAVDRIAPNVKLPNPQPLDSYVEEFYEWDIEKKHLKGNLPIQGATFVDELGPYLERKLFLLNGIHAIVAYAGYQRGYETIDQAIGDEEIFQLATAVQAEAIEGLLHSHSSLSKDGLNKYARTIIRRFQNEHLHDEIARVGRDPLRKLGDQDRLITPLLRCLDAGVMPNHLIEGIAAAYGFFNADDPQAVELREMIGRHGIEQAVRKVSAIESNAIITAIAQNYQQLPRNHSLA